MGLDITVNSITTNVELSSTEIVMSVSVNPNITVDQLQADLAQTDNTKKDFVKNKKTSNLENDSDFVSDADYATDKARLENTSGTNTGDQDLSSYQTITDALLETDSDTIVGAINEVNSIAKGANQALSFNDYQAVIAAMLIEGLNRGQNLYVDTLDVPDLWIKSVDISFVDYTYVSDEQFITDILAGFQIGYYTLALLETQKVDLTNYYTKDETDQAIEDYAAPLVHDHKTQTINPDAVIIDKQYTDLTMVDLPVGAIFYNVDQLCWLLKLSTVNYYNFGEELPMLCKNGDASTHLEGTAVYISSGSGQLAVLQRTSSAIGKCNAIATADVLHTGNGRGYYCFFGMARSFPYSNVKKSTDNENTWVDGAALYLCSELGKYSTTQEDAPAKSTKIGTITNRNGANITVMFTPDNCVSMDDLCDVDGTDTTIADTDEILKKDTAGLWKKVTWANVKVLLNVIYGRLATTNTWALLQTFTSGLKTTKIIPNSDTTGVVISNAADGADVVKVDTANLRVGINVTPAFPFHIHSPNDNFTNTEHILAVIRKDAGGGGFIIGYDADGSNQIGGFIRPSGTGNFNFRFGTVGTRCVFGGAIAETTADVNGTTTLRDWVYLNSTGTRTTGDIVGDRKTKNILGVKQVERVTGANTTKGSGATVIESKVLADGSHQFGNDTNNVTIDSNGTIKLNGTATVFDDLKASALSLQQTGSGISQNIPEACVEYTTGANLSDYMVQSLQMPHTWKVGSVVHPHIHYRQTAAAIPNFLLQYRWQINGQAETTAWTNYICNVAAFPYTSGTINQIVHDGGLTPPIGATLSDIVEFRVLRDNANTSGLFAGADALAATVRVKFFDVHFEQGQLGGSNEEYVK